MPISDPEMLALLLAEMKTRLDAFRWQWGKCTLQYFPSAFNPSIQTVECLALLIYQIPALKPTSVFSRFYHQPYHICSHFPSETMGHNINASIISGWMKSFREPKEKREMAAGFRMQTKWRCTFVVCNPKSYRDTSLPNPMPVRRCLIKLQSRNALVLSSHRELL